MKNEHPLLEHIKQSNLIEGVNSRKADKHSLEAWLYLESWAKITHEVVCGIHLRIMKGLMPTEDLGIYRRCDVFIGGRMAPHWEYVEPLMINAVYALNHSKDPIATHIQYEHVHPFPDGNGRSGRMLLWWHQMQMNQQPTLYKASECWQYYELFGAPAGGPPLMD